MLRLRPNTCPHPYNILRCTFRPPTCVVRYRAAWACRPGCRLQNHTWWPLQRVTQYVFLRQARTPEPPKSGGTGGPPGPPDIDGLPLEIIGFRERGGGPVGHPQGVQVRPLIRNQKMLPKEPPRRCTLQNHMFDLMSMGFRSIDTRSNLIWELI